MPSITGTTLQFVNSWRKSGYADGTGNCQRQIGNLHWITKPCSLLCPPQSVISQQIFPTSIICWASDIIERDANKLCLQRLQISTQSNRWDCSDKSKLWAGCLKHTLTCWQRDRRPVHDLQCLISHVSQNVWNLEEILQHLLAVDRDRDRGHTKKHRDTRSTSVSKQKMLQG